MATVSDTPAVELASPKKAVSNETPGKATKPPGIDAAPGDIKIPESVDNVVKRLNTTTDDVTLEDLNAAREAVAKLDILIDIEKRLTDLATIRQERDEKSMANAIPASALGMRGGMPQAPVPMLAPMSEMAPPSSPPVMMMPPEESVEVQRIMGTGGHYVALLKVGEGKEKQVRAGDKLSDGSVVDSVSERGVTLTRNKKQKTIQVKDVGTIFGGR